MVGEGGCEANGKDAFDDDESELDPERHAKDFVVAVVDAESLVFGAQADGGDDVSGDEEEEHAVVQVLVVVVVVEGESHEAAGACSCCNYANDR